MTIFRRSSGSFDRTYEGLKLVADGQGVAVQGAFDRTYEGLKQKIANTAFAVGPLLTVPMRV